MGKITFRNFAFLLHFTLLLLPFILSYDEISINDVSENMWNGLNVEGIGRSEFAGDFNGDGLMDLVLGSFTSQPNSDTVSSVYLIFGTESNLVSLPSLTSLNGQNGVEFQSNLTSPWLGFDVFGLGDLNNDGFDDIGISSFCDASDEANGTIPPISSASYVVYGRDSFATSPVILGNNISTFDQMTTIFHSTLSCPFRQIRNAGHFLSSNIPSSTSENLDVIISSPWEQSVYLLHNSNFEIQENHVIDLSSFTLDDGITSFTIPSVGQGSSTRYLGWGLNCVGDVNDDGFDDIGIALIDPSNPPESLVYVLFGSDSSWTSQSSYDLTTDLNSPTNGLIFSTSGSPSLFFGYSLQSVGDFNGDGIDDFGVTASTIFIDTYQNQQQIVENKNGWGEIIFGRSNWGGYIEEVTGHVNVDSLSNSSLLIQEQQFVDYNNSLNTGGMGISLSALGDVDGDGFSDVGFGLPLGCPRSIDSCTMGITKIVVGSSSFNLEFVRWINIYGNENDVYFGAELSSLPYPPSSSSSFLNSSMETNGSFSNSIAIGAPFGDSSNGEVFLVQDLISILPTFSPTPTPPHFLDDDNNNNDDDGNSLKRFLKD